MAANVATQCAANAAVASELVAGIHRESYHAQERLGQLQKERERESQRAREMEERERLLLLEAEKHRVFAVESAAEREAERVRARREREAMLEEWERERQAVGVQAKELVARREASARPPCEKLGREIAKVLEEMAACRADVGAGCERLEARARKAELESQQLREAVRRKEVEVETRRIRQEAAEQSEGELNVTCLRLKSQLAQSSRQVLEVQAQVTYQLLRDTWLLPNRYLTIILSGGGGPGPARALA